MKLETFFEKFDQLADAPDAVAKMRELVLRLAMSAKLVEQDSNELDGSKVFNAIQQARAKHLDSKKISFVAATDWETAGDDCELPNSWHRCAISDVCDLKTGATPSTTEPRNFGGNARWLLSGDINRGEIFDCEGRITELGIANSNCKLIPKDSVLIALNGQGKTRATVALLRIEAALNQSLVAMIPYSRMHLIPEFLFWNLRSRYRAIRDITGHEQRRGLNMKLVGMLSLPLPPIEEQKRIVARVEGLMALCDRLEGQQMERETRYVALARAAVARFDEAPTPANLNFLFHPSYSVTPADLRKIILNLAVQGKLVPQVPRDETAAASLARLGLGRRTGSMDEVVQKNEQIPESWSVVRFEDVAVVTGGVTLGRKLGDRKTVTLPYLRVANVKRGEIDVAIMKEVTIAEDEIERYALRESDLLMTEGGDWDKVGRAAIWSGEISPCLHQNHIFRARMRSAEIKPFWFERYFNSPQGRSYFESASKQTTNLASINMRQVRGCPVPFPPLAEQNRILARVDLLMKSVDQLEQQIEVWEAMARDLLDAVVHELLHPTADVVEFPCSETGRASQRAAIGCYAIEHLLRNPSFGRVMLMKTCYLAETHLGLPLGWQPMRQAAGPWDPWVQDFESMGTRSGWFTVTEKTLNNGYSKIDYSPRKALQTKAAEAVTVLGNQKAEFDRLLNLFADKSTEEAEIIATLFAAWNDFLIDGKTATDDEILHEVRENWHQSKGRFTPALLQRWLDWMRRHRLTPQGHGPRTRQQLTFRLK